MGFYVEPKDMSPEEWVKQNAQLVCTMGSIPRKTFDKIRAQKMFLLCAIMFEPIVVGICLTPRIMQQYYKDHAGHLLWFVVPEDKIFAMKPYLREGEQEYKDKGMYDEL